MVMIRPLSLSATPNCSSTNHLNPLPTHLFFFFEGNEGKECHPEFIEREKKRKIEEKKMREEKKCVRNNNKII